MVLTSERANRAARSGGPAPDMQGKPGTNGVALDAVFVHRAMPENISRNWTYLDHPLINENPKAILYITQNWNPGGSRCTTYNDHPVGVWYDPDRQRWAIFNQLDPNQPDRINPMPKKAAFNVAVLKEAPA